MSLNKCLCYIDSITAICPAKMNPGACLESAESKELCIMNE